MKNALYLRLLTPAQGCAKNGAAIATELIRHESRIGGAEKREDCRIPRLNHRSNLLYEFVWYAELVLPPRSVECACSRSECASGKNPGSKNTGYWSSGLLR
jgi:hypothetical protein